MGLNKVGIGPNTAAHRDKLSKSHREEQGLSSWRGTEHFTGHTVFAKCLWWERKRRRVKEEGRRMRLSVQNKNKKNNGVYLEDWLRFCRVNLL